MRRRMHRSLAITVSLIAWSFLISTCLSSNDNNGMIISQYCAPRSRNRHTVDVNSLSLACSDEDGYSSSCSAGDTTSLTLDFTLKKFTTGSEVELHVSTMYGGKMMEVLESTSLCSLEYQILQANSNNQNNDASYLADDDAYCDLLLGKYRAFINFTVPDFGFNDNKLVFTPDLRIQFFDSTDRFKIGCVETGTLAQSSLKRQKQKRAMHAFMACIAVFIIVFVMILLCFKEKKKLSELDIVNKRALRRFHYKRTSRSGLCPGVDDERSVTSSVTYASEWSRRQFT